MFLLKWHCGRFFSFMIFHVTYLVSSADEIKVVLVQETRHDGRAERVAHAAVVLAPIRRVLIRIGPEQVAEQAGVGHVRGPHYTPDLLHGLEVGTQSAMTAENLLIDDGRHRETVEAVGEGLPEFDCVAPFACNRGKNGSLHNPKKSNQSINQSIDQWSNQSINRPFACNRRRRINQTINRLPACNWIGILIDKNSQSINQSTKRIRPDIQLIQPNPPRIKLKTRCLLTSLSRWFFRHKKPPSELVYAPC